MTIAAVAFGSRPLGVAGIGLLLAAAAARAWAGLAQGPARVTHESRPAPVSEGERVRLVVTADRASRIPVGSATVRGSLGRLGEYVCRLQGRGRGMTGSVDLGRVPRGLFTFSDVRLVLGDHLGLESVSIPQEARTTLVVHPRIVELRALFNDPGRVGGDGRRLLLRRPAGFDFHSVREYEQGESLRRVHWPTTARRGQLMVKELEDSPQDSVVVLLDCSPAGAVGTPPRSSFDDAVRAAGSVLRAYAARGRRAALVATGADRATVSVRTLEGDFRAALDVLAAAEPTATDGLARALRTQRSQLAHAGELVVVTALPDASAVEALVAACARRLVSVVWIDAPSYAGIPTRAAPGVLRLAAAGVPVAAVRSGDDLARALDPPLEKVAARA
ncbi:MAG TPA: DUF58 domain-containing protein [Gaiellaceae bacterium]|nr:DUF58 domain-containing protein [Gaiellaceae bacterium]